MSKFQLTKDLEGSSVFGIGTGNNSARGGRDSPIERFEVVKVARKYATLKRTGGFDFKCTLTGVTSSNCGYLLFLTPHCAQDYKDKKLMMADIRNKVLSYSGAWIDDVSYDDMKVVHGILCNE